MLSHGGIRMYPSSFHRVLALGAGFEPAWDEPARFTVSPSTFLLCPTLMLEAHTSLMRGHSSNQGKGLI